MKRKRKYIVRQAGKPEILLFTRSIAYHLAEMVNAEILEIIN